MVNGDCEKRVFSSIKARIVPCSNCMEVIADATPSI